LMRLNRAFHGEMNEIDFAGLCHFVGAMSV
jgi:hypothetical protein